MTNMVVNTQFIPGDCILFVSFSTFLLCQYFKPVDCFYSWALMKTFKIGSFLGTNNRFHDSF